MLLVNLLMVNHGWAYINNPSQAGIQFAYTGGMEG